MKVIILLIVIFIPLFLFRYHISQQKFSEGDKVRITAWLNEEPYLYNKQQVLNISDLSVYAPHFPEYHYGDKLEITGIITRGTKTLYLKDPKINKLKDAGSLPSLRRQMLGIFQKTLPEQEGALVAGATLGAKESLPADLLTSLKISGTMHVVVASGMNITLLSRILLETLIIFIKRKFAIPFAFAGVWAYVVLIGTDAPIVRAAIMGSLTFTAQALGKVYFAWWALFLAAGAMLLFIPSWIGDIGFLLSFAATAGILAFEPLIKSCFSYKIRLLTFPILPAISPIVKVFEQDLFTSLAAQIAVTPILFVAFGQFAPWSPIVNGLLLWTVAPMMVLGFLGGIIGLIIEPLGQLIILLTYPLALYFTSIVQLF